jgi:hypothetical protein
MPVASAWFICHLYYFLFLTSSLGSALENFGPSHLMEHLEHEVSKTYGGKPGETCTGKS